MERLNIGCACALCRSHSTKSIATNAASQVCQKFGRFYMQCFVVVVGGGGVQIGAKTNCLHRFVEAPISAGSNEIRSRVKARARARAKDLKC